MSQSDSPFILPTGQNINLPKTFNYKGKNYDISEEIKDRDYTSLLVIKDGKIVFEEYYKGNKKNVPVIFFSCTKSITSLLIGISLDKGYIKDLNDPISKYVPELKGSVYSEVPIQDVLNMSSGIEWSEDMADFNSGVAKLSDSYGKGKADLIKFILSLKRAHPSGTFNKYASVETQILGMVIEGATKKPYIDFFKENLWNRIFPESTAYLSTNGDGVAMAYGGLMTTPRDYAKAVLLMINKGKNSKNQQILSEEWIKQSITISPKDTHLLPGIRKNSDTNMGYKNQWWIPENRIDNEFTAIGVYGQFAYVNPKENIIIISNGADKRYADDIDIADGRKIALIRAVAASIK
ncbi:serine hydrolase domain-containing protein [Chryseobacterium pennipullorum]|uniref:Serine hydrolase n=1 Tax=Chryseobacterium pennipullorum TaxID=2258963 RepID=A0A3D9B4N4_9FLAO|nr:serine hydrolase [Chryseobacterium pennipullorum]REC48640.1 serine hydrolase [Chryseobacterium pennipullorum]